MRNARIIAQAVLAVALAVNVVFAANAAGGLPAVMVDGSAGRWVPQIGPNGATGSYVRMSDTAIAAMRNWSASGGKIVVSDVMSLAGRAGPMTVNAVSRVAFKDAAAAIARCIMGGGPLCAAGTAAVGLYAAYRIYRDAEGNLKEDPGQPPVQETGVMYGTGDCQSSSAAGYLNCMVDRRVREAGQPTRVSQPVNCVATAEPNTYNCTWQVEYLIVNPPDPPFVSARVGEFPSPGTYVGVPATLDVCPAVPPNIPKGSPRGADGKCPTDRSSHRDTTPDDAGGKVGAAPPPNLDDFVKASKDAVGSGEQMPGEREHSGPGEQVGPSSTSTSTGPGPNGGQQTTTTTTQPTYRYVYEGDKITVTEHTTTVTNVCTGDGSCTTTTTGVERPPEEPAPTECEKNPKAAGCAELGKPGDGAPQWSTKVIPWEPESLGLPSGCPPPFSVTIRGWVLAASYQPVCDVAPIIRLGLVALVALGTALFVVQGCKT